MKDILLKYVFLFPFPIIALFFSALLTKVCIFVLPRFGMIDIPHGRHQHERPVPRGGGIAIILSFFLGIGMMMLTILTGHEDFSSFHQPMAALMLNFLPPALLITALGIADDRYDIRSIIKLAVHIVIAVFFYWRGCGIESIMGWDVPICIGLPVTICWVVGIINAFNLIDGLDGIAAGLASIASISLAVWSLLMNGGAVHVAVLLIFCASCLGFLRYNFYPAKIFMGDTGSTFIGLFFAYISMTESSKAITLTSLLVPLMAIGIPLFDVFLAIWRRFFRRYVKHDTSVNIMVGDHDHLHHRILKEQGNQRKTAYVMYFLAFLLSACAMASVLFESHLPALIFTVFCVAIFTIIRYANIEILDTMTCVADGMRLPHKNFILTAIHPVFDTMMALLAFCITCFVHPNVFETPFSLENIFLFIGPFTFCLCISGIYHTFWLRAGINRYHKLVHVCLISGVAGFTLIYLHGVFGKQAAPDLHHLIGFYLLFFLLTMMLIVGERFALRYYESFGYKNMYFKSRAFSAEKPDTIVIYGGGLFCRLYLLSVYSNSSVNVTPKILGILDDNPALQHLNVYGFDVLGGVDDLEKIFKAKPFTRIVIALRDISPEIQDKLAMFAYSHKISIHNFACVETDLQDS